MIDSSDGNETDEECETTMNKRSEQGEIPQEKFQEGGEESMEEHGEEMSDGETRSRTDDEDTRQEVIVEEVALVSVHSSGEASSVGGPEAVVRHEIDTMPVTQFGPE